MVSLFWIVLIGSHASMQAAEPDVPLHIDVKGVDPLAMMWLLAKQYRVNHRRPAA